MDGMDVVLDRQRKRFLNLERGGIYREVEEIGGMSNAYELVWSLWGMSVRVPGMMTLLLWGSR
jgi:hypothetical protein